MDIHIQFFSWEIEIEHEQRVFPFGQQAAIASFKRILEWAGLHPAPINKEHHVLPATLRQGPVTYIAMQDIPFSNIHRYRVQHLSQGQMIEFRQGSSKIARAAGL